MNSILDKAPLRLAARDAANLYFETERAPANIVDVYVFEPPACLLSTEAVIEWMVHRLEAVPIARRRLHRTWADIDYPAWVVDETVDLGAHIIVVHGESWAGAKAIVAERVGSLMDLSRPPWDVTLVTGVDGIGDGIPDGATVAILRFHHSIGDAVATAAIGRRLFGAQDEALRSVGQPTSLAGPLRLALRAPLRVAQFATALGAAAINKRQIRSAAKRGDFADSACEPPGTRFGGYLRGAPAIGLVHFDLADVRGVCAAAGVTVNDVMLAVIASGLADLLDELGEAPGGSLAALMPMSVTDAFVAANRFALETVDLHTQVTDRVARLVLIHAETTAAKLRQTHPVFARKRAVAELIPALAARTNAVAARWRGGANATTAKPTTMVSNVPGKTVSAEFMGARIVDRFGVLTLSDGAGIAHFISSAGPRVSLAFSVDREMLSDLSRYEDLLKAAFDSLVAAHATR